MARLTALQALRHARDSGCKTDSEMRWAARSALIENGCDLDDASRAVDKAWRDHFAISEAN